MLHRIKHWLLRANRRRGQSLIEYTLLLGFIVLASSAIVFEVGDGVLGIAENGDEVLASANAGPAAASDTASGGGTASTSNSPRRHSHHRWHR